MNIKNFFLQTKTVFSIVGVIALVGSIIASVGCNTIPQEDSAPPPAGGVPSSYQTPEAKKIPAAGTAAPGGGEQSTSSRPLPQ